MTAGPQDDFIVDDDSNMIMASWSLELLCRNKVGIMTVAHKTVAMAKVSFSSDQAKMTSIDLCFDPTGLMNLLAKWEMIPLPFHLGTSRERSN